MAKPDPEAVRLFAKCERGGCRHCARDFPAEEFALDKHGSFELGIRGIPTCPCCGAAIWCRNCRAKSAEQRWWENNRIRVYVTICVAVGLLILRLLSGN